MQHSVATQPHVDVFSLLSSYIYVQLQLRPILCDMHRGGEDCDFSNILHWLNIGFTFYRRFQMAKIRGVILLANDFLSFEMLTFQCCNCFTVFFCWWYLCVLQQKPDLLNLLVVSTEAAGFCYLFMCVFVRACVCVRCLWEFYLLNASQASQLVVKLIYFLVVNLLSIID